MADHRDTRHAPHGQHGQHGHGEHGQHGPRHAGARGTAPGAERFAPLPRRPVGPRPAVPVLSFLGGTGTVTGSRFLVETPSASVLVDCGLFQGVKALRLRNWDPFPVDPARIDAVVLTHAHVDHSGFVPGLVRAGFGGLVHATDLTESLAGIVLPDTGRLNEEEARYANERGFSRHSPALPLFTEDDAHRALERFAGHDRGVAVEVAPGVSVVFRRAGHILGSAFVELHLDGPHERHLLFSGDVGRPEHPVLRGPEDPTPADIVLCESTYGDRTHAPEAEGVAALRDAIVQTVERDGTVVIPAFAVDRTEVLLFHLAALLRSGAVPRVPVHLDSPMAARSLDVYAAAVRDGHPDVRRELAGTEPFAVPGLQVVHDTAESRELAAAPGPRIVISASGMLSGGRVLHHVARRLGDRRNTIVLVGFQAEGTRGRALLDGARELKLLGRYWPVRCQVVAIDGFSVHADRDELVRWLGRSPRPPELLYGVHGEPPATAGLVDAVGERLGWRAVAAVDGERVRLD